MTIRTRILAVTVPTLLLAVIVTSVVAVIAIRKQYAEEATQYRAKIDSSQFSGDYNHNDLYFLGLHANWKF